MDNFYCFEAECVHRDNSNLMSCEPGCWATQQPVIDGLHGKNVFSVGRNGQIALRSSFPTLHSRRSEEVPFFYICT